MTIPRVAARPSAQLDDLARAVADGVPRRVVVGRIAAFMAAFIVGDPELAFGAKKKRCPKGRRRCGDTCCKPGYVCQTKKHRKHCVCPKPKKACNGRCVDTKTDARNCGHCGQRCNAGETCVAGTCRAATTNEPGPVAATCSDGVRNGNETDVDCGGPSCPKCADGRACVAGSDCVSGVCSAGVCVEPTPACSAEVCGAQHGCPACTNGRACAAGTDCASGHCAGGVCVECSNTGHCTGTTASACHAVACVSGACTQVVDDTNVPSDGNDCTDDVCTDGVPSHPPKNAETVCAAGVCDGKGSCVGCTTASDCGTDTACVSYTCTEGQCGTMQAGAGSPAGSATCSGSTLSAPVCDANGDVQQSQTSCAPYVCQDATSCHTSCSSPADCDAGHTCVSGTCVARQCTNDTQCSVANGSGVCNAGICEIGTCDSGHGNCDGMYATGCETDLTTVQNCGTCGHTCSATNGTATCTSGACAIAACDEGYADCDGNPANGCEVSTGDDFYNCGACGNVCGDDEICMDGQCKCVPGDVLPCYTGPPGTQGVGTCHGGTHTCGDDWTWGPCVGEVTPPC